MIKAVVWSIKIFFMLIACMCAAVKLHAQHRQLLNNDPLLNINNYEVLPDKGYSFSTVLNDTSLVFKPDSLRKSNSGYYWIKLNIVNPYPNNERYIFSLSKPF